MRLASVFFAVVGFLSPGASALQAAVTVSEEGNGRIVLEVRFDPTDARQGVGTPGVVDAPGWPAVRYERIYVALPWEGSLRAVPLGGEFTERRGGLTPVAGNPDGSAFPSPTPPTAGFYPATPVVVSEPFVFRKTRVVAVDCYASQVDYGAGVERRWSAYGVDIAYTPAGSYAAADESDPLLGDLVVNRSFVPAPRALRGLEERRAPSGLAAGVPDPHFSLSGNWIRVTVDSTAVYSISGSDLSAINVALTGIDPRSFRVFTRGGRQLERRDASGIPFTDADGTWRPGEWMTECSILVEGTEDEDFDPTDRIIFYGVAAQGWVDTAEPGTPRYEYEEHLFSRENAYYLTWDAPGFPNEPRRMQDVAAAPIPSGGDITDFEERLFIERNQVAAYSFGGDGWQWLDIGPDTTRNYTVLFPAFEVHNLLTARTQKFRTRPVAAFKSAENNMNHHAVYLMNGPVIGEVVFDGTSKYENAVDYETTGNFLREGANTLRLRLPRDLNAKDFMMFDHYEVFYRRQLRVRGDRLAFACHDTTGTVNLRLSHFTSGAPVYLFDVSDPFQPRRLIGYETADAGGRDQVRFSHSMGENASYFFATTASAFDRPLRMARRFPRDLRNVTTSPHMLIVCHPAFRSAADRMKAHRAAHYPYPQAPDIEVVTTEDIFDNFSGGLVDPMGIRNYMKFLYDNFEGDDGRPRLTFVLFIGDANVDSKNFTTAQENLVTTNLNLQPQTADAYATDDWFAELEPPVASTASLLQVAVGRLPAGSASDAHALVDRVIRYETESGFGPWRERVLLVADDEKTPGRGAEPYFVSQTETIANVYMARFLEPVKIYLTEFPLIGSSKPSSRLEFIRQWNEGALAINYIGHGSSAVMADEQVFLGDDVANLRNGLRLPVFMAFSCTIGDFGRAQASSLAERLLLWEPGGAVAAITASEVSFIYPNAALNYRVFQQISPSRPGAPPPLGVALMKAKTDLMSSLGPTEPPVVISVEQNNHKYNLLGDPSLPLVSPRREISFSRAELDTLTAGKRAIVRGAVLRGGAVDTGFHGSANLLLREPDDRSGYTSEDKTTFIDYRYPGGTVYTGTADVTAGAFEFSVKVPQSAMTGPLAFVRVYADDGSSDAVALFDSAYVAPPVPGETPLDGPPRIDLGFKGGQTTVKRGVELQANIRDADGINVLRTTAEGKMVLVFDRNNLPLDVTGSFRFDHGGTDTSGVLLFPLPDLAVGGHEVVLKVADSFGLQALDTLGFTVVDPANYVAEFVLNYPNPFARDTHFLFELTDPADVRLDIFTVSGKKIRTIQETKPAGQAWIFWDGRDSVGDPIANGTYLYVARVSFLGLDRPPLSLRGKVVKIE